MRKCMCMIILFLSVIEIPLSAYNLQKVYSIDDPIYNKIRTLLVSTGMNSPSSSGPWSGAELARMVERLNLDTLDPRTKELYEQICARLYEDDALIRQQYISIMLKPVLTAEAYIHTNADSDMNDMLAPYGYNDQEPFILLPVEVWLYDSVYGVFDLNYQKRKFKYTDYAYDPLQTNLLMGVSQVENYFPFHALMAWGNSYQQFTLGRDRLSWGNGKSGNFIIGDGADYYDFLQYTIFGASFEYTFLMTQFNTNKADDGTGNGFSFGGRSQIFIAHRYEIEPFSTIRMALTESSFFCSDGLDLRMFSPVMFLHNYYDFNINSGQQNNIMGFTVSITFFPGYNIYTQGVVDQIQVNNEMPNGVEDSTLPNAFGVMFGIRREKILDHALVSFYVEGVYTSPYLYLNMRGGEDLDLCYTDYDFIVSTRTESQDFSRFLGYEYGPDAIVASLGLRYATFDDDTICGKATYIAHGVNRLIPHEKIPELKTGPSAFYETSPSGSVEHGFRFECDGERQLSDWFSVHGSVVWTGYWNYLNGRVITDTCSFSDLSGDDWQDIRCIIGVSLHPIT